MTAPERLVRVLGAAVCVEDEFLGHVTGVVGDASWDRIVGLEVAGADGALRFLPWVAATFDHGIARATSHLVLFDAGEVESYIRLGAAIVRERGGLEPFTVSSDGRLGGERPAGTVSDEVAAGTSTT